MKKIPFLLIAVAATTLFGCATTGQNTDASSRKAVKVAQTERGVVITSDERILFDSGKSAIKEEGQVFIDRVTKMLKEKSSANVQVEGHADNTGGADLNARLSESRAQAVRAALVKTGVDAKRISAKGYGFSKPVADNATPEGRQMNRRTEILLVGEKIENVGGEESGDRLSEGFANFLKDPVGTLKNAFSG